MKNLFIISILGLTTFFMSCGGNNNETSQDSLSLNDSVSDTTTLNVPVETQIAKADLFETADSSKAMGMAKFYDVGNGDIKMQLDINYPAKAKSSVAVHFHEHGDCGNKGENAHGHWNPTGEKHGKWGSAQYHSGDIGNIELDSTGLGSVTITTNRWSISDTSKNNIIGRGIIIHGGVDDYTTQPTGNSGARIGCGIITK